MTAREKTSVRPGLRITRDQIAGLREAAYDGDAPHLWQRNDLIVTLLYDTGAGPGDLADLDVADLGADCSSVSLPDRTVNLDPDGTLGTRRLVRAYLRNRWKDADALFPSRKADRITARGIRYVVDRLATRAGIEPLDADGGRGTPAEVTPEVVAASSPRSGGATTRTREGDEGDAVEELPREGSFAELALNTVVDLFYVLDADGHLHRWNDRVNEVTGYSDDELADLHALELVVPEDRETIAEATTAVFEGSVETRESHLLTRDGTRIPYEFNGAPITGPGGEVLGLAGTGRDLTDRKVRERELERYRRTVNAVGDGVYQLDAGGRIVAVNDVVPEVTGYDREQLVGSPVSLFLGDEDIAESVAVIRDLLENDEKEVGKFDLDVQTADGDVIPAEARIAILRSGGEFQGTVGVVRDVSERVAREHELRRQRDELETLARINAVVRTIDRALVRAETREEIEQAACDNLAGVDAYRFAWVGDYDPATDRVEPRASAGVEEGYLDDRPAAADVDEGDVTAETAYRTGEVQVARDVANDPEFTAWRDAALERGYRSAIAIPLTYWDATYGVLCVYAPRPDAFDVREFEVLTELGETIAHALSAVERQRALMADSVVELDLGVRDPSVPLSGVSRRADCELELNGTVTGPDDGLVAFVTASGGDPEAVVEAASESSADATVVSKTGDEALLRIRADSPVGIDVTDHGGIVRDGRAIEGEARFTVEFPHDVEVRTVVETVRRRYEDVEVLARHERERTGTTGAEFRTELDDAFTDRQREVIEAAYLSGFFEWPRATTGEELAETLGIATPTFHEHVRLGERKLFEIYFEE